MSLGDLSDALARHASARPERGDVVAQMRRLARQPEAVSRRHFDPGHFTASGIVCSVERDHLLLIHHVKLGLWLQPGGHLEPGELDLESAARREVREETGVADLSRLGEGVFDVDVHEIPARPGEPAHRHFDVRYAFAAERRPLTPSSEVKDARWVPLERVAELTSEESIARCVAGLRQL